MANANANSNDGRQVLNSESPDSANPSSGAVRSLRRLVYETVEPLGPRRGAFSFRIVHHCAVVIGIGAMLLGTVPDIAANYRLSLTLAFDGALGFFVIEYLLRLYAAPEMSRRPIEETGSGRLRWLFSSIGLVDALAVLPLVLLRFGVPESYARLFGLLWVLKFVAYSEGLTLIARVIRNARDTLASVFLIFAAILLTAATFAYLFEREAQPVAFGSIPAALWWAIVTGSTTGYGDVVPVTLPGRLLAGIVMISGAAMIALWTGILANGFAEEIKRREFLRTWDLVAKAPYFKDIGASAIADVTRILKPREFGAGYTIMRQGDAGDCMYFVVSGTVRICLEPYPLQLGPGDFFGEIALVTGAPRTATAIALNHTVLLELDVADFRALAGRRPEMTEIIRGIAAKRRSAIPVPSLPEPEPATT